MNTPLRILILEDTVADAQIVVRHLQRAGLQFAATRVATREDFVAELGCDLDVILADYELPAFDGLSALAIAQGQCPNVPFIFVSGVLGEERAIETLKAGATDYVLKERLARLVPAVERALEEAEVRRARRAAEEGLHRRTVELEQTNLQLAAAYEELAQRREELQLLSRRLVEVQEAERAALSRDLHDTAAQALTAIAMGLSRLARQRGHTPLVEQQIADLRELTDQVVVDLRRLAVNLRPASLDRYGLASALEQYLAALQGQHGLAVALHADGLEDARFAPDVETALYRIVQEALANVVRHAQAQHVTVTLSQRDGAVVVQVADDGVGCDVAEALSRGRLGLLGMRERAEMLGGTLRLESAVGAGTRVEVRVPVG